MIEQQLLEELRIKFLDMCAEISIDELARNKVIADKMQNFLTAINNHNPLKRRILV